MRGNRQYMKKNRFLSFLLCVLLMCATALCVNKSLFGHSLEPGARSENTFAATDTVSRLPDGTLVIHTGSIVKKSGYSGQVPLDIYVKDGVISDIKALPNTETPAFFSRATGLFSSWVGKTSGEAAATSVDAVTGATYSSEAIIANVQGALDWYSHTSPSESTGHMPWKMWVALGVVLAACVIPLFVKNRTYQRVQLVANIVVLGFWCGQFLDYTLILKYLSEGMSFPGALVAAVMLVAAFIYPLFGKSQYYCNHICPLGSAQILVAEICRYKIKTGAKTLKALDWFRKILWAVLMLCLWADVFTGWMNLELFQAFMYESASAGIIVAALVFVALSAVVSRPYCRFVCPTGSLFKRAENLG